QTWSEGLKFYQSFLSGRLNIDWNKSEAKLTTEQVMALKPDQPWNVEAYSRIVKQGHNPLWLSLAATVGLVIGLLIAGMLFRFTVVLLTSVWGLKLTAIGIIGVMLLYGNWMQWFQNAGWKEMTLPAGVWLLGIGSQGVLARKRKGAPPAAPAAAAPAK
ncbi:MAG: hypothetical protein PHU85_15045, partial [Phycisphaerae bacterium]|nr:hypothetical protein [Phycisphaerae bacterium]